MKIRLNISDLNEALARASTVKPSISQGSGSANSLSAYLFTISDGRCYIHSQDGFGYVRTEVPLLETADPDGSFVYPADRVEALKYLDGWIDIETGKDEERYYLKYKTEGGATANRTVFDPDKFNSHETSLAEAATEHVFPTILLREGLAATSRYLADHEERSSSGGEELPFQTIQIFDKSQPDWEKGDGTMFAADGQRSCYFASPALAGKGIAIHSKHLANLTSFLSKCGKTVKVKMGRTMTFVVDQVPDTDGTMRDGSVFGWSLHPKLHPKYKYYAAKVDKFVLLVSKHLILKSLRQIRSEIKDTGKEKVRVIYSNEAIKFAASVGKELTESIPLSVQPQPLEAGAETATEFASNANVNYLIDLFETTKSNNVELRVALLDGKKALFRTVEKFAINDAGKIVEPKECKEPFYECMVTYFSTSMD